MATDEREPATVAIVPCNDVTASVAFYARLGFVADDDSTYDGYVILHDGDGASIHLTDAVEGWLVPGRNPFGLYVYRRGIDDWAIRLRDLIIESSKAAEHKPWGMYEFAVSDPDDTLVRIGWPSRLLGT